MKYFILLVVLFAFSNVYSAAGCQGNCGAEEKNDNPGNANVGIPGGSGIKNSRPRYDPQTGRLHLFDVEIEDDDGDIVVIEKTSLKYLGHGVMIIEGYR